MSYTVLAVAGVAAAVLLDLVVLRTRVLTRRLFWTAYAIVVVFQLITNGWLTGRDIVTYDDSAIVGVADRLRAGRGPAVRLLAGGADAGVVGVVGQAGQRLAFRALTRAGSATASRRGSGTATRRSSTW